MGSQCGRLCCRPCRKQLTLQQRIDNIFSQSPVQITEAYCRNKGTKLCEYLKDRRSQIPSCISRFKLLITQIPSESSERSSTIILLTLKSMTEQIKDFLNLTYLAILQILKMPYFTNLKTEVYETLKTVTSQYPDSEPHTLEDILTEILRYLAEPKNLTKQEINLLQNLLIPIHTKITENNVFDWKKLTELILDKIVSDSEAEEELELLRTFSKELFEVNVIRDEFFKELIQYLHRKETWSKGSLRIFEAVIGNANEHGSYIVKLLFEYLHRYKSLNLMNVGECIVVVLKNSEGIDTIYYSELFKRMLIKIVASNNTLGKEILDVWSQKANISSFFKLFADILLRGAKKTSYEQIISGCKKRVEYELGRKKPSVHFLQGLLDIIYDCVDSLRFNFSEEVFKHVSYLIEKICGFIAFKKAEVSAVFLMLVKVVKNCGSNTEIMNRVGKIAICVILQNVAEHVPLVFSLIVKIRSALDDENSALVGIIVWVLLKVSGIIYQLDNLVKFTNKSIKDYAKTESIKSLLLSTEEFNKIMQLKKPIFMKNQKISEKFSPEVFKFEDRLGEDSKIEELNEEVNDEEYLGFNISENDYSSASSMEFQERVIDPHDVKAEFYEDDYTKMLMQQEEFDKKFLDQVSVSGKKF